MRLSCGAFPGGFATVAVKVLLVTAELVAFALLLISFVLVGVGVGTLVFCFCWSGIGHAWRRGAYRRA